MTNGSVQECIKIFCCVAFRVASQEASEVQEESFDSVPIKLHRETCVDFTGVRLGPCYGYFPYEYVKINDVVSVLLSAVLLKAP